MRVASAGLADKILDRTIGLLVRKEPHEIGMREIAQECGISATSIYMHYKDKDALFYAVILSCVDQLKSRIEMVVQETVGIREKVKQSLIAFRDWCFDNPRLALLVMGKMKAKTDATVEELQTYYRCHDIGVALLVQGIAEGSVVSVDPQLDMAVLISATWGTIEAILLKRANSEYWNSGKEYTRHFIDRYLAVLFTTNK